jgi:DNA gyrase subunit A
MEIGMVRKVDIDEEMQQSYMDYAMSVIVARALPDARDGLKPVQRRILYAMYDMGLRPNSSFKKSARIVGEVLGKYHPHGDMAVYEAMARLAQDFTIRYPLVDGQGNFGSIDGDPPAAMRYTEARVQEFAMELLGQIDRETVNFADNFDGTLTEPLVLPSAVPNLLVNGSSGIAVGMATNIPPHNLGEVIDALVFLLKGWNRLDDIDITDLMSFVKGPDFPTGGIILQGDGENDLLAAYATGKGKITVRGRVHAEDMGRGRSRIIISELPYNTNKTNLIERIAELARDGGIEGISDLRDESDRQGMRIVLELSKTGETDDVLRKLYHRTPLQNTFGIHLLALVDEQPRLLTLKQALLVYLDHRLEVTRRRCEFDLKKAKSRAHILEGLLTAINNLDEVIQIIRRSPDTEKAHERLKKQFNLSDVQAQAILDMPLKRLAALERKKIEQEHKDLQKLIKDLEILLRSPQKMRDLVEKELIDVKEKYDDRRRTQIVSLREGESMKELLTVTDLTPAREVWVGVTSDGLISRTQTDNLTRVSGRDAPLWVLKTTTHDTLYLAGEDGQSAAVSVDSLPETEKFTEGLPVHKVSGLNERVKISSIFTIPQRSEAVNAHYVVSVTEMGMVKKTFIADLPGPSSQPFTLVRVNDDDVLRWVFASRGDHDLLLLTAQGMAIRFSETDVRAMGLVAAGVNGIKLKDEDFLVGACAIEPDEEIFLLANNGLGWRYKISEFPTQGRYGQGVIACKLSKGNVLVGLLKGKNTQSGMAHFEKAASRLIRVDQVAMNKRGRVGQEAIPVKEGDEAIGITELVDYSKYWESVEKNAPKAPADDDSETPKKKIPRVGKRTAKKPAESRTTRKKTTTKKPVQKTGTPADKAKSGDDKSSSPPRTKRNSTSKPKAASPRAKKSAETKPVEKSATKPATGSKRKGKTSAK